MYRCRGKNRKEKLPTTASFVENLEIQKRMDDGSVGPTSLQQRAAPSRSIISSTLALLPADRRPDVRENLVTAPGFHHQHTSSVKTVSESLDPLTKTLGCREIITLWKVTSALLESVLNILGGRKWIYYSLE